jgi:hypothetical protein
VPQQERGDMTAQLPSPDRRCVGGDFVTPDGPGLNHEVGADESDGENDVRPLSRE